MLLGPVAGADTREWRTMMEVNGLGLLYCTHAALPIMGAAGSGHVVNISSVAGRTASMGVGVYNFTKWGVTGFSEALRQECSHANVRVTTIEPGFTESELAGHNTNPIVLERVEKMKEEYGEILQASDIADSIVWAVTRPNRVNVNEILIRPTGQTR